MSCGVSHGPGSELAFLWLWYGPAAAALIQPLGWEPPYAVDVALKRKKKKKDFSFTVLTVWRQLAVFRNQRKNMIILWAKYNIRIIGFIFP